ncbi:BatA domain-containing protein [Kordiimonas aestuarii]|uniref:BatA domain-containing protein n=1 Tax=Kordiimonas aestuarii TaxID=1005925 RepID=UPI0021D0C4D0|nr:BatA domain-containing protein [Kordiimonas aestuarii]
MPGLLGEFSVTNAAGLAALTTVAVPVLIHLFNKSKGKRVVVGSIELIKDTKSKRLTEIKLMHYVLLCLRVLIFILAALLMAGLSREATTGASEQVSYVTPFWLAQSTEQDIDKLQANVRSGDTYLLAEQIVPLKGSQLHYVAEKLRADGIAPSDHSTLLLNRLSTVRHNSPIHVYSTGLAREFNKIGALRDYNIKWHVNPGNGVGSPEPHQLTVHIIASDETKANARFLFQTLERIGRARNILLAADITEYIALQPQAMADATWVFWPEDLPLTELWELSLREDAKILLVPHMLSGSTVSNTALDNYPFTRFSVTRVEGNRQGQGWVDRWATDDGISLLTSKTISGHQVLRFRFDPFFENNGLAAQPDFPIVLLTLLLGEEGLDDRYPDARINLPTDNNTATNVHSKNTDYPSRPLATLLCVLLLAFWIAERWLSERLRHA